MAQQTQIGRVGEAWVAFTGRFPSVTALAAADPADVIRSWRGLGYNRRALNLWRAARTIVEEHGGEVPRTVAGLQALPGVGPYTARAVAAIAFGASVGAVDTNVRRVLSRSTSGSIRGVSASRLQSLADASVPRDRAADWTHAVMDVGATFCRTTRPLCDACPARPWCRYAARDGADEVRPVPDASGRREAFPSTSRWLRGRIMDRLRDADPGAWLALPDAIGSHDRADVTRSLAGLATDGLAELHPEAPLTARLPIG